MTVEANTARGAMPRPSATQGQAGRAAPGPISWPFVPREGEGTQSGASGATPNSTPGQGAATTTTPSTGATPSAQATTPTSSATDDADQLGDAGKRAIQRERERAEAAEARAKAAEERAATLESTTLTDQEKAVRDAARDAERARDAHWMGLFRTNVVEGALRGAGIVTQEALETALAYPRFATLKVNPETGVVDGVNEAVEAYKKAVPQLFGAGGSTNGSTHAGGPWGGAEGSSGRREPGSLSEALEDHYSRPKR